MYCNRHTLLKHDCFNTLCVEEGSSDDNAEDDLLLIVIISLLSALILIIIFVIVLCLCLLRRRRASTDERAISGEVAGLYGPDAGRLRFVRRLSYPSPVLMSRPSALRWFPEYGPARSWAYLPASWQQAPSRPDLYGRRNWAPYNDDLSQIVSVFLLVQ